MPEGPVILNNTPLVALSHLNCLAILRDLYGEILIPESVYAEFLATETRSRQTGLANATWIKVVSLADAKQSLLYVGLDRGEADVLAIAIERKARLVVIDERRGRRYAQRLGLPLTGTLGVLLLAKEKALISSVVPLIKELQNYGLRLEQTLIAKVLELAGEKER